MSSLIRRFGARPVVWVGIVLVGSILSHACGGSSPSATAPGDGVSAQGPQRKLAGKTCVDVHSLDECADYFALRTTLLIDLREIEAERDQRNVATGLGALTTGDPLLEAAGLSIVGPFPDEKGVAEASARMLLEPGSEVQSLAALALANGRYSRLQGQWTQGHKAHRSPFEEAPEFDLAKYKIVVPADAQPYPPGDSAVTAGYLGGGDPASVLSSLSPTSPAVTLSDFGTTLSASVAKPDMNAILARMQAAHGDPKVVAELEAEVRRAATQSEQTSLGELPMPTGDAESGAKAVVLEGDSTGVKRWAVVYPEPLYGKTVVIFGWSPTAYPPREL